MELLRPIIKPNKRIKKSGFEDAFFVIAVIFAVVIFIVILSKTWGDVKEPLDEGLTSAMPAGGINVTETLDKVSSTTTLFDKLFPLIIIGLFAFVLIGASIYANHPIMLFVGIIILAVAILIAVIFANIYNQIVETDEFTTTSDDFGISTKFMEFLPQIILIMFVAIGAVVLWARSKAGTTL